MRATAIIPIALGLWCSHQATPSPAHGVQGGKRRITPEESRGHERMLALLARVHARMLKQNPYIGDKQLQRFQGLLERADPATTPKKTLARLHYDIGISLLRFGNTEDAIESMKTSYEILTDLPRTEWPPFSQKLLYDLGVGNMRLGEAANCIARHTSKSCILPIETEGIHVDQTGSRTAMRWFREARRTAEEDSPLELSSRWLLNVAAMTIGEYPDGLRPDERIDPAVFASEAAFPRFEDVAPALGLNSLDLSGGAVVEDLDGDGFLDVLSSSWHTDGQLRFFRNQGDGTFAERTNEAGLTGIVGGLNLVQADYNNDGFVDVLVLRGAWLVGRSGQYPNSLLRNNGAGTFIDVTFRSGLGETHYPTQTAAWADYDLDGDLDLYVGNEALPDHPFPCQLFRNDGVGSFTDVAAKAGVQNLRYTKGVSWGDFDGDRYPDLYVSNLLGLNRLYRNRGDGTFEDVAGERRVAWPFNSFPTWFWDFDNDGSLDLFVGSYDQGQGASTAGGITEADYRLAPVVASYLGKPFQSELAKLYRGDGKGGFQNVAAERNLKRLTLPMGSNFGDLDNDGFPDFYLGTGYPFYDGLIPNVMYWNRGGRTFVDVTTAGGFGHLQKGHGVAFADLDNDGDQDVFEQMGGAYPGDVFGNALFENPGFGNHWLKVKLVGVESNRSAIGARIRLEFEEDGSRRSVYKHVNSGGSFGCNPLQQHLGVGQAETIDRLEVYWPKTDRTQTFRNLAVDRKVEIVEGVDELRLVPERAFKLGG